MLTNVDTEFGSENNIALRFLAVLLISIYEMSTK